MFLRSYNLVKYRSTETKYQQLLRFIPSYYSGIKLLQSNVGLAVFHSFFVMKAMRELYTVCSLNPVKNFQSCFEKTYFTI